MLVYSYQTHVQYLLSPTMKANSSFDDYFLDKQLNI